MVRILSDSTCDLSQELLERFGIGIIQLNIVLGDQSYQDGIDITPDEIYAWSDENRTTPKTAACSVEQCAAAFEPLLKQGDEVICFAISESMSSTLNSMRLAAEMRDAADRVHAVNSANLSTGNGLLVIEAAIMAQQGEPAQAILSRIAVLKHRVRSSFVVDTLTYLHRGGRCSGVAALMGGTLKLHPKIVVQDGKMLSTQKYRGRMNHVVLKYAADLEQELLSARKDRVFITHSGCSEELIAEVRSYLESLNHFDEILVTRAGGVISSHCGPGTLGVLYIA